MIGFMMITIALLVVGYLIGYTDRMAGAGNDAMVWLA